MSSLFPFSSSSRLKGPHMKFQIGLTMDPNYGTKNVTPKTHQECAHLNPTLTSSPQKKKKKRTEIHYCPNKERIILVVKTFLCAFTLRRRSFFLFFFRDIIKSNPLLSKPSSLSISHNSLPYGICEITKRKKGFLPSLPLFLSKCYQRKNPFLFLLDKEEQGEDSPLRVGFFYCFRGERERGSSWLWTPLLPLLVVLLLGSKIRSPWWTPSWLRLSRTLVIVSQVSTFFFFPLKSHVANLKF